MDVYNPYVTAILSGAFVYFCTYNQKSQDNKTNKQTNLNYVFLASILVFVFMNYINSNNISIEPTLNIKYDE